MMELHIDLFKLQNNTTLSNEYINVYQISFQLQNWFISAILAYQNITLGNMILYFCLK